MTIAWVVGSGGLLGSALCRTLQSGGTEVFKPAESFHWKSAGRLERQLGSAARAFSTGVADGGPWELYWAAGVSSMGSSEASLATETRNFSHLLHLLESEPRLAAVPGAVAFASSAGAIYAGSTDDILSEESAPAPNTPYARAKMEQEELLRSFAIANRHATALLARLSTLYGPGQSRGKPQGLIAHIARCLVRNQPVRIYVPLDTVRDYLASDDAAVAMVTALRSMRGGPAVQTRIIASERPTTIAEIVAIFRRIARRAPRIVTSASPLSVLYPRRVQFRSTACEEGLRPPKIGLLVGICEVMAAERAAFMRGVAAEGR